MGRIPLAFLCCLKMYKQHSYARGVGVGGGGDPDPKPGGLSGSSEVSKRREHSKVSLVSLEDKERESQEAEPPCASIP